jgi:hypothetical protein
VPCLYTLKEDHVKKCRTYRITSNLSRAPPGGGGGGVGGCGGGGGGGGGGAVNLKGFVCILLISQALSRHCVARMIILVVLFFLFVLANTVIQHRL